MRILIIFLSIVVFGNHQSVAQTANSSLQFSHLTGNFYIYVTYNLYKGERIPANAMYLVTDKGVVLFDTPWDSTQFQPLLDSIKARHNKEVILCIATHFHEDRSGGLEYYTKKGIQTYTTVLTDELSKANNKKRAANLIAKDTTFIAGNYSFETFYPGPGHTKDNIVIWFKKERIVYGACLIKSTEDDNLGYLGDADTVRYASTVKRVLLKCKQPRYVIVGHGDYSKVQSLQHTYRMALDLKKSRK